MQPFTLGGVVLLGIILVQCIIIFIGFIASGRNFDGVMSRYYASHMTEDIKVLKNEDQSIVKIKVLKTRII